MRQHKGPIGPQSGTSIMITTAMTMTIIATPIFTMIFICNAPMAMMIPEAMTIYARMRRAYKRGTHMGIICPPLGTRCEHADTHEYSSR